MKYLKFAGKFVFAMLFLVAGAGHFISPGPFVKIVPPYLPFAPELVFASGVFEVVLGVMLVIPQTTRLAAWGLIALLIAVFPANIYMYQHRELFGVSPLVLLLRLPLQGILILWAWVYTRKPSATAKQIAPGDANDLP
jgi:uncharacterized membrane protein